MANENEFLLHALLMGIFITYIYDLLRIFRRVVPHNGFFVSAEDLFFWIYCGGEVFLLMYHESDGTLRWFAVLGALLGMFLYRKLVSPFFVKYVSIALKWVLSTLWKILRWLCRPLGFMCRKASMAAGKARRGIRRAIKLFLRGIKNRLTYFLKVIKINLKA